MCAVLGYLASKRCVQSLDIWVENDVEYLEIWLQRDVCSPLITCFKRMYAFPGYLASNRCVQSLFISLQMDVCSPWISWLKVM
jgi:hypothetical protein